MSKVMQVKGRAVPVLGDDIDTDRIIPARYLKEITFSKMGDYPFFDERFNADGSKKDHSFNNPKYQGAKILLANVNFGCGSSREHAPQSLMRWGNPQQPGIKAIVAESYAEIFAGNCVMLGIPALTASKEDVSKLQKAAQADPQAEFNVDLESMSVKGAGLEVKVSMLESRRKALLEGTWDSTGILISNADKVKATAAKLPYLSNFA
jgi:3-isopropylmalate/(R)-2-methylmalate dehydratase small subunit